MVRKALVSESKHDVSCVRKALYLLCSLLTRVPPVVLSPAENLERARHITQVKLILKAYEDLDRLEVELIRLLNDCTWERDACQRPMPCMCGLADVELSTHSSLATVVFGDGM